MKSIATIIFTGAVVVLVYDTAASFLPLSSGVSYGLFSLGSFLLYVIFGFLAARRSKWYFGAATGAILGFVDSTVGWAISWNIGPGKPAVELNMALIVITVIFVVVSATVLGLFGGVLSLVNSRHA